MATNTTRAVVILDAVDRMSRTVNSATVNATRRLESFGRRAANFGRTALTGAIALGAPLALSAQQAVQFEDQMGNVATLVDTGTESMKAMSKEVLNLGKMPVALNDLTTGLYDVRSAGVSADDAIRELQTSAKLGVGGLGTTTEAVNIMTSSYNAFKGEALSAEERANIFFKTVKAGKTTIAELSQAFGATAPVIQSAGVKLADFQAATAALTTGGTPAAQAQNQLRAAVSALIKPTGDMEKIFTRLGVKSGQELLATSGSMGEAFTRIKATAGAMNINLAKAVGRVEALGAVQSLTGAVSSKYVETLADMTSGTDALSEAYVKQEAKASSRMKVFRNTLQRVAITAGNVLIPPMTAVIEKLGVIFDWVGGLAERFPGLTKVVVIGGAAVAGLLGVLGITGMVAGYVSSGLAVLTRTIAFFTSGTIRSTIARVAHTAAMVAGRVATLAMVAAITAVEAAQWAWNAAMTASPWGLVVIGIGAVVAGITALARNWDSVTAAVGGAIDWIGDKFRGFVNFLGGAWKGIVTGWQKLGQFFRGLWLRITGVFSDAITWIKGIPARFFEAGKAIIQSLVDGMKSIVMKPINFIKGVAEDIAEYLPFSPAKRGPLRNIMKVRIVESIAETMKPAPAVKAMQQVTKATAAEIPTMGGPAPGTGAFGNMPKPTVTPTNQTTQNTRNTGSSINVNFSPRITVTGGGGNPEEVRGTLMEQMKAMIPELQRLLQDEADRIARASFA